METFRIAENQLSVPVGSEPETFYWLELKPDLWIGTNRPCETREEATEMLENSGHGSKPTKTMHMLFHTRYLKMTAEPDTFKITGRV